MVLPVMPINEVLNVRWDNAFTPLWDPEPHTSRYHVYRDALTNLPYGSFGARRDDLDGDRTDTTLIDMEEPVNPGDGFAYLITAEDVSGEEGTLGYATGTERSNFAACP